MDNNNIPAYFIDYTTNTVMHPATETEPERPYTIDETKKLMNSVLKIGLNEVTKISMKDRIIILQYAMGPRLSETTTEEPANEVETNNVNE